MTTRFKEHLLEGDHASLPLVSDVPVGTLYACTDHSTIYQTDGSIWIDWFIGGAGSVGPEGPEGPEGPAGPTGPAGAGGITWLDV